MHLELVALFENAISSKNLIPLIWSGGLAVTVLIDDGVAFTVNPLGTTRWKNVNLILKMVD